MIHDIPGTRCWQIADEAAPMKAAAAKLEGQPKLKANRLKPKPPPRPSQLAGWAALSAGAKAKAMMTAMRSPPARWIGTQASSQSAGATGSGAVEDESEFGDESKDEFKGKFDDDTGKD